jgi:hypothetical protein
MSVSRRTASETLEPMSTCAGTMTVGEYSELLGLSFPASLCQVQETCLVGNNMFSGMRVWMPRKKDFLHRMNFKISESCLREERSTQPFLAMQPRLALAGVKIHHADAREGWREPTRVGENTAGEIRSPPADTPPYLHLPVSPPKAAPQFSPFRALRP